MPPSNSDNNSSSSSSQPRDWSVKEIRDLVEPKFHRRPCWFQIKTALALREGKDVVGIAATGAGKTLLYPSGFLF
jgi:superfamily II DNA/RNA helicase